jgi:hypothetical protein
MPATKRELMLRPMREFSKNLRIVRFLDRAIKAERSTGISKFYKVKALAGTKSRLFNHGKFGTDEPLPS